MITRRRFLAGGLFTLLAADAAMLTGSPDHANGENIEKLEDIMARRRTVRSYSEAPLKGEDMRAILWAAQGITDQRRGYRTAPSAGALYPLNIHLFTGKLTVDGLEGGVYLYDPASEDIDRVSRQDLRAQLAIACLSQTWIRHAPASLVISAVYRRTTGKYRDRGIRYTDIEAGCAAQNVLLMAVSKGLAAGIVGAFKDDAVRQLTGSGEDNTPLLVLTIGFPA